MLSSISDSASIDSRSRSEVKTKLASQGDVKISFLYFVTCILHYLFHILGGSSESRVKSVDSKGISLIPRWLATDRSKAVILDVILTSCFWSRCFISYFVLPSMWFTCTVESGNIARPLTLRKAPLNEHYTTT